MFLELDTERPRANWRDPTAPPGVARCLTCGILMAGRPGHAHRWRGDEISLNGEIAPI